MAGSRLWAQQPLVFPSHRAPEQRRVRECREWRVAIPSETTLDEVKARPGPREPHRTVEDASILQRQHRRSLLRATGSPPSRDGIVESLASRDSRKAEACCYEGVIYAVAWRRIRPSDQLRGLAKETVSTVQVTVSGRTPHFWASTRCSRPRQHIRTVRPSRPSTTVSTGRVDREQQKHCTGPMMERT